MLFVLLHRWTKKWYISFLLIYLHFDGFHNKMECIKNISFIKSFIMHKKYSK